MARATEARLVLLPGAGASGALFEPLRRSFERLVVPPWLTPLRRESLEDYGRRMAATIPCEEPFYLGGVSFGGMVALEAGT